jgi:amino acid transporter
MGSEIEKKYSGEDAQAGVYSAHNQLPGDAELGSNAYAQDDEQVYDPSKESRMTRLGLTKESFKRAPGTTR